MAVAKHFAVTSQQLQRQDSLVKENVELRDQLRLESELVGGSPAIKNIENQIARVAAIESEPPNVVGHDFVGRLLAYA